MRARGERVVPRLADVRETADSTGLRPRRMREKLLADLKLHGNAGLDDLPRDALRRLEASPDAKPKHPPGGDAG